jgi:hypothetical protein
MSRYWEVDVTLMNCEVAKPRAVDDIGICLQKVPNHGTAQQGDQEMFQALLPRHISISRIVYAHVAFGVSLSHILGLCSTPKQQLANMVCVTSPYTQLRPDS